MSLILDALKKLERERASPDQVVVVGSIPWQGVRRARRAPLLLVLVVLGGVGSWLVLGRARTPASLSKATTPAAPSTALRPPETRVEPPLPSVAPPGTRTSSTLLARPGTGRPGGGPAASAPEAPARAASSPAGAPAATERPEEEPLELRLMAISSQQGRPVAVINDRVVHEGDRFEGVRVVRIGEAEVELEVRGRRRVLRF